MYSSHFFTDFLFVILGKFFKAGNLFLAAYGSTELNSFAFMLSSYLIFSSWHKVLEQLCHVLLFLKRDGQTDWIEVRAFPSTCLAFSSYSNQHFKN